MAGLVADFMELFADLCICLYRISAKECLYLAVHNLYGLPVSGYEFFLLQVPGVLVRILFQLSQKIILSSHVIEVDIISSGKRLQLVDDSGEIAAMPPKERLDVYCTTSGRTVAVWDGKLWDTIEVEKRKPKEEVKEEKKKGGRPRWKPGPNHPWRKFTINPKKPQKQITS